MLGPGVQIPFRPTCLPKRACGSHGERMGTPIYWWDNELGVCDEDEGLLGTPEPREGPIRGLLKIGFQVLRSISQLAMRRAVESSFTLRWREADLTPQEVERWNYNVLFTKAGRSLEESTLCLEVGLESTLQTTGGRRIEFKLLALGTIWIILREYFLVSPACVHRQIMLAC